MSNLRFTIRPAPVLPEHRPLYKISQLLLILSISSRGGKSSLPRLQLLNWGLKTKARSAALEAGATTGKLLLTGWGFDPAVPLALIYAVSEGLIKDVSTGYELTEDGESFVRKFRQSGLLGNEYETLQRIGKRITETMVNKVAQSWEEI